MQRILDNFMADIQCRGAEEIHHQELLSGKTSGASVDEYISKESALLPEFF